MYFSKEFLASLKQSIPIEKLIGLYVELTKRGDQFVGLCPFHDDHHPSFTIFPDTQSFYCFGCQAGAKQVTKSSDHIAFLMSYHNLSFPQAVEMLTQITNTPLPYQQGGQPSTTQTNHQTQTQQAQISETLLPQIDNDPICQEIFNLSAEFYHQQLFQSDAKFALDYLTEQRDRNLNFIKQFKIGFAKGGRVLYQFLKSKGFSDQQLLNSQLIAKRGNRILDYFLGNIIIFPHFQDNNVIGFTIKDLDQYKSPIKLRLFSRNTFYNQDSISGQYQEIILVEGESDLHSIVQFTDHNNVLALCGNQLTQVQLHKLLSAGITTVYLALDRDAAGKKATQSITKKLSAVGITVCPLQWNCHKDIDLWLRFMPPAERKSSFEQLIVEANKKSATTNQSKIQQTKDNRQQKINSINQRGQTNEPSNLQVIKELIKAVAILLTTIFILLKNSKTYIKQRKNPRPKTSHYHKRPSFSVDKLPVFQPKEDVPNYRILLQQYQQTQGKKLKPVNAKKDRLNMPAVNSVRRLPNISH